MSADDDNKGRAESSGDKCVRCGEVDLDRRTLWMACFYEMNELGIPFEQVNVVGQRAKIVRSEATSLAFEEPSGQTRSHPFYTLRVCKECRGEWMAAIRAWYRGGAEARGECHRAHEDCAQDQGLAEACRKTDDEVRDIPVRMNGATVMMTRAEYEAWRKKHSGWY
jgi:hypothetical protein